MRKTIDIEASLDRVAFKTLGERLKCELEKAKARGDSQRKRKLESVSGYLETMLTIMSEIVLASREEQLTGPELTNQFRLLWWKLYHVSNGLDVGWDDTFQLGDDCAHSLTLEMTSRFLKVLAANSDDASDWIPFELPESQFGRAELRDLCFGMRKAESLVLTFDDECSKAAADKFVSENPKYEGKDDLPGFITPYGCLARSLFSAEAIQRIAEALTNVMRPIWPPDRGLRFSDDYRSGCWLDVELTFSEKQAAVVRVLHSNWQKRTPCVHKSILFDAAESEAERLDDLFKRHQVWKVLIISDGNGRFRLAPPTP